MNQLLSTLSVTYGSRKPLFILISICSCVNVKTIWTFAGSDSRMEYLKNFCLVSHGQSTPTWYTTLSSLFYFITLSIFSLPVLVWRNLFSFGCLWKDREYAFLFFVLHFMLSLCFLFSETHNYHRNRIGKVEKHALNIQSCSLKILQVMSIHILLTTRVKCNSTLY
jgi:hypothetical protein